MQRVRVAIDAMEIQGKKLVPLALLTYMFRCQQSVNIWSTAMETQECVLFIVASDRVRRCQQNETHLTLT